MKLKRFKERDHKRIGVIVFTLVCLFLISGAVLYRTFAIFEVKTNQNVIKGTVQGMGDIEFAFYIDDKIVKTAPSISEKEKYVFDEEQSNCTNSATVYWDYQRWGPNVSNLTETKTKCYLKFKTEYSEPLLNGAVPELEGDLTPVKIEEDGTVKRADTTTSWYNYGSQQWANAVITGNSYDLLGSNVYGAKKENGYVHLDGTDDYIDLGLTNYQFTNGITLAITVKFNKIEEEQDFFNNYENGGSGLELSSTGQVKASFFLTDNKYHTVSSDSLMQLNQYYTIVATYNNETIKLYINGIKQSEENKFVGAIVPSPISIFIGANPESNGNHRYYSNIDVKQAAIFNRAIGENEIQDISNNNFKTNGEGLLKYVDFTNKTYEAGEVISEDNIESYFVWIPRYKYQIWNGEEETKEFTTVKDLGTIQSIKEKSELNQAKEIKIEFENRHVPISDGTLKNQWLTHPAFTSFNSNGFWAGKFETGYKGATSTKDAEKNEDAKDKVVIKPNVYSWRGIQVANAFSVSQGYQTNLDSHMMKNMEWGAVAYLTYSQYGICKEGQCEDIHLNNNNAFVTGYGAKDLPTCDNTSNNSECYPYDNVKEYTNGTYTYNYLDANSKLASTTKNYTGIYDMVGGTWEYVMGVLKSPNSQNPSIGNSKDVNSGFQGTDNPNGKPWPSDKYYDLYEADTGDQNYYRGHLGDGTKETGPFYSIKFNTSVRKVNSFNAGNAVFASNSRPWVSRGGEALNGSASNIMAFANDDGNLGSNSGFRIVLTP